MHAQERVRSVRSDAAVAVRAVWHLGWSVCVTEPSVCIEFSWLVKIEISPAQPTCSDEDGRIGLSFLKGEFLLFGDVLWGDVDRPLVSGDWTEEYILP